MYYLASRFENTDRVVKYCIHTPSCGRIERPIFWETESIRIDSSSESNRIDSNCELECTSKRCRAACWQRQETLRLFASKRTGLILLISSGAAQARHSESTDIHVQLTRQPTTRKCNNVSAKFAKQIGPSERSVVWLAWLHNYYSLHQRLLLYARFRSAIARGRYSQICWLEWLRC